VWCFSALEQNYLAVAAQASVKHSLQTLIAVDVLQQQLRFYQGRRLCAVYPVSTAANGTGCETDSGCTPTGWHQIYQKIGAGCPIGTVFGGRVAIGKAKSLRDNSTDDLITSRILWLSGLESGHNLGGTVDSRQRYIYIHGTAQEHLIGRTVSHGCIRMENHHVIQLFDRVEEGTPVFVGSFVD